MKEIRANMNEELLAVLRSIDISVPPKNAGRMTEHCETWSICRLLATLAKHNRIKFPIQLTKRERPDFLLKSADRYIGIEVTEAINEEYAKATTLPEAYEDGTVITPRYSSGVHRREVFEIFVLSSLLKSLQDLVGKEA